MINRIIEWSANNPFLVFLFTAAAVVAGWWSAQHMALDAIPDLSETQVIVSSRWDRSPDIMEDQVTYPIVTAMLGAPRVKDVRAVSDFGSSYVYVIFEDETDVYWARSRTLEYLSKALPGLPSGVKTELGPDAAGIGWVFQYAVVDKTGKHNLEELRSLQDWYLRYHLQTVPGVAEVASVGGFVRQYQINVDPRLLAAYNLSITKVIDAVRSGNNDVGGRLLDLGGREYMVRGRGYAKNAGDLGAIALGVSRTGVPIQVSDVGTVVMGPDLRRGAADLDGQGEAVCGIVVTRPGENALRVIDRVKAKLRDIGPGLPPGVEIVTTYDRSELILGTIGRLRETLLEELVVVAIVILVFLWHFPSAIVPIVTIPVVVTVSFGPMFLTGTTANVMSLGGIAIAVGAMVDAAIVLAEQAHKKAAEWERHGGTTDLRAVIIGAMKQVGTPAFYSLLVIAVAFLPVFALGSEEGRLFRPLAFTKSFAMIAAAVLAITLDPALRLLMTRFRWPFSVSFRSEENHPINRHLIRWYAPVVRWCLHWRRVVIGGALALVLVTIPVYRKLGSEFMPPLDEGALLFMPATLPGITLPDARRLAQAQDRIIASFPEVKRVTAKVGRADTATDPAPPSMIETVILLKPPSEWPRVATWYDGWPGWLRPVLRRITPDRESTEALEARMDRALHAPGVSNAWTMPIRNRIEMQNTGIRTAVGVKVTGSDVNTIEDLGKQVESALRRVRGTRSAFAERINQGYFLDFDLKRDALAGYGLSVDDAQAIVTNAIGGEEVSTIIDGPARYTVNVRYLADFRNDPEELSRLLVPVGHDGKQVPLGQICEIKLTSGPSMLRNDDGLLAAYVYADVSGRDVGSYVAEARRVVGDAVHTPPGYALIWSGQYESIERVRERLKVVLPLTVFLIVLLLYWNTRSFIKTSLILLAVPFSAVGAIWLLAALGYNLSVAVWVGLISLLGVDAETGVFMLLYLDLAFEERKRAGLLRSPADLDQAIVEGAAKRIRPKLMTVMAMFGGLLPIMCSVGPGTDVMKRIAAPMLGGIVTSFLLELAVCPVLYALWRRRSEKLDFENLSVNVELPMLQRSPRPLFND
jgi:Cu(I)/Ag(I) efflux system membrane protein CusA/SilA